MYNLGKGGVNSLNNSVLTREAAPAIGLCRPRRGSSCALRRTFDAQGLSLDTDVFKTDVVWLIYKGAVTAVKDLGPRALREAV